MAITNNMTSAVQEYVFVQSLETIILPVNGSWIQAYCEYLGITSPVNTSWLQALCQFRGITQPTGGSWVQALAVSYGITEPVNTSWWMALASLGSPVPPFIWNLNTNKYNEETRKWSGVPIPTDYWEDNVELWEADTQLWELA